jgi:hypothetical protein
VREEYVHTATGPAGESTRTFVRDYDGSESVIVKQGERLIGLPELLDFFAPVINKAMSDLVVGGADPLPPRKAIGENSEMVAPPCDSRMYDFWDVLWNERRPKDA